MNNMPWFAFYPSDWIKGTRDLSAQEKGIWIDLLAYMWESPERGKIHSTWEGIARMVGVPWLDCESIILGMVRRKILEHETNGNGNETLVCRRMIRDQKNRKSANFRLQEFRKRSMKRFGNGNETRDSHMSEVTPTPTKGNSKDKDKRKDVSLEPEKSSGSQADLIPPVMSFPCTGQTKEFRLYEKQTADFKQAFPALDVMAECRKARGWLLANPSRQKTERGMPRFLFSWMERSQNNNGGRDDDRPNNVPAVPSVAETRKAIAEGRI